MGTVLRMKIVTRAVLLVVFASSVLGIGACTTTLESHPDYIVTSGSGGVPLAGEGDLVLDAGLRDKQITASPQSATGAATSVVLPIGQIIRDVSTKVLSPVFTNGTVVTDTPKRDDYGVLLRLDDFRFKYDQLSNLGFAITPKVTVSLTIEAIAPNGRSLFRKTYVRTDYSAGAYIASINPAEKVNRCLHLALGEIFRDVADDLRATRPAP